MEHDPIAYLERQLALTKKKLERSEQSRELIEQAKDHYDLVYRSSIERLDAQKNLLDIKNKELDIVHKELVFKNQQLLSAQRTAEQANEAKSKFLANMSHEIRTPINGILGFLELLELTKLDDDQQKYLKEIHSASEVLLFLINDILDFSKIEAGQMVIESIPFCVNDLLESAVAMIQPKALKKGIDVVLRSNPEIPRFLIGDSNRILQVLSNLLSNGVKFTEKGLVQLTVSLIRRNGNIADIEFVVEDTGIGMRESELRKLFNSFTQADSSITRKYGGTGLGLVISQELAKIMGGGIRVWSIYESGSRFSLKLPLEIFEGIPDVNMENTTQEPVVERNSKALRILLAEDNETNILLMEMLLKRLKLTCDIVKDGMSAIKAASSQPYDLILMDCQMPVLDGYQAARRIRDQAKPGYYPVIIAMTANAMIGDRERCLEAGMDDYLSKPISRVVFEEIMKKYMDTED